LTDRKSLSGLVVALTVLLSIVALVSLAEAAGYGYRASLLANAADGVYATDAQAELADAIPAATGILTLAFFVVTAVVFIVWQFRHAKNAQVLGSARGLGPGWAIGGWFIPLANYILPAVQIHQSSRVSTTRSGPPRSALLLIVPWAITFGLGTILSSVALGMWPAALTTADDLEMAAASDVVDGVASFLWLVAALLCIAMVRTVSGWQSQALDERATELSAQAMPWPGGAPETPPPSAGPPQGPENPAAGDDPWRSPSR
jgi:hypothetical protein